MFTLVGALHPPPTATAITETEEAERGAPAAMPPRGDHGNHYDGQLLVQHPQQHFFAPIEATGLSYNSIARGAVSMSTLFLGPALLKLAKEAAALNDNYYDVDNDDEEGRIYGMKPTSLLTNIGIFSGLLSCILTPVFGAIVDHTPHRRLVGQVSSVTLSIVKGIEISVGRKTWFFIAILQVLNFVLYNAYLVATYAYTAELSGIPDEQTRYNSQFQTIYYISMLTFLVVVTAVSSILALGDVGTARISQTMAFVVGMCIFTVSWKYYFRPRPALREIPPSAVVVRDASTSSSTSWLTLGFTTLSTTFSRIRSGDDWYALRYFLLSVSLSESATSALSTISTTYMMHVLDMDASQIGKVFLCVFLAAIPGSKLGGMIGLKINPLRSACLCLTILVLNTMTAAYMLDGPEDRVAMYGFAAIWGVCLAWLHPTHASLYCTIIPKGQESELMGVYIFSGSVLAWLPPLLFTFLNEIGASMTMGLVSLNLFFIGGFILLLKIGNYNDAVAVSRRENLVMMTPIIVMHKSHDDDCAVMRNIPTLT